MGEAAILFTLAGGKAPSRQEERWILWELPICRALLYYHCALRSSGEWTVAPVDSKAVLQESEFAVIKAREQAISDAEDDGGGW